MPVHAVSDEAAVRFDHRAAEAYPYRHAGAPPDDLVQVARIALVHALERQEL